ATCDGTYCYLQCQGARRYVSESTNVNAAFYVRPETLASSSVYPDDYSTASYTDKDIFVTIAGRYSGQIDTNDPLKSSVHMESWKLTLTRSATVTIKVQGTWASSKGCLLYVYSDSGLSS